MLPLKGPDSPARGVIPTARHDLNTPTGIFKPAERLRISKSDQPVLPDNQAKNEDGPRRAPATASCHPWGVEGHVDASHPLFAPDGPRRSRALARYWTRFGWAGLTLLPAQIRILYVDSVCLRVRAPSATGSPSPGPVRARRPPPPSGRGAAVAIHPVKEHIWWEGLP